MVWYSLIFHFQSFFQGFTDVYNCQTAHRMLILTGMGRNGAAEMARTEMVRPKWRDVERARKVGSGYLICSRPNGDIYNGTMSV